MNKVKIKRVERNTKKPSLKEKVFAGLGLGSSIVSGAAGVSRGFKQQQIVSSISSEMKKVRDSRLKNNENFFSNIFKTKKAEASYGGVTIKNISGQTVSDAVVGETLFVQLTGGTSGAKVFFDGGKDGVMERTFLTNTDGTEVVLDANGNWNGTILLNSSDVGSWSREWKAQSTDSEGSITEDYFGLTQTTVLTERARVVTGISVNDHSTFSLQAGYSKTLTVLINYSDNTQDTNFTAVVDNSNIAQVSVSGNSVVVTGLAGQGGSANLILKSNLSGETLVVPFSVEASKSAGGTVTRVYKDESFVEIKTGEVKTTRAWVDYDMGDGNYVNDNRVNVSISDPSVADVVIEGNQIKITGKKAGNATITFASVDDPGQTTSMSLRVASDSATVNSFRVTKNSQDVGSLSVGINSRDSFSVLTSLSDGSYSVGVDISVLDQNGNQSNYVSASADQTGAITVQTSNPFQNQDPNYPDAQQSYIAQIILHPQAAGQDKSFDKVVTVFIENNSVSENQNGSVNMPEYIYRMGAQTNINSLSESQKNELAQYFLSNSGVFPSSFIPGSFFSEIFGVGSEIPNSTNGVPIKAILLGYEYQNGNWVHIFSIPGVSGVKIADTNIDADLARTMGLATAVAGGAFGATLAATTMAIYSTLGMGVSSLATTVGPVSATFVYSGVGTNMVNVTFAGHTSTVFINGVASKGLFASLKGAFTAMLNNPVVVTTIVVAAIMGTISLISWLNNKRRISHYKQDDARLADEAFSMIKKIVDIYNANRSSFIEEEQAAHEGAVQMVNHIFNHYASYFKLQERSYNDQKKYLDQMIANMDGSYYNRLSAFQAELASHDIYEEPNGRRGGYFGQEFGNIVVQNGVARSETGLAVPESIKNAIVSKTNTIKVEKIEFKLDPPVVVDGGGNSGGGNNGGGVTYVIKLDVQRDVYKDSAGNAKAWVGELNEIVYYKAETDELFFQSGSTIESLRIPAAEKERLLQAFKLTESNATITIINIEDSIFAPFETEKNEISVTEVVAPSLGSVLVNGDLELDVYLLMSDSSKSFDYEFEISDDSIVQVNKLDNGKLSIKGLKVGPVNIRIKNSDGSKYSDIHVTVSAVSQMVEARVVLTNKTNSASNNILKVGDQWQLEIFGTPGMTVYGRAIFTPTNGSAQNLGETNYGVMPASGKLVLTGTMRQENVGQWQQTWSVRQDGQNYENINLNFAVQSASAANNLAPVVSSVTPANGRVGQTVTINISGANLTGAVITTPTNSGLSITNISVNSQGTTATATLRINDSAPQYLQTLILTTSSGSSQFSFTVLPSGVLPDNFIVPPGGFTPGTVLPNGLVVGQNGTPVLNPVIFGPSVINNNTPATTTVTSNPAAVSTVITPTTSTTPTNTTTTTTTTGVTSTVTTAVTPTTTSNPTSVFTSGGGTTTTTNTGSTSSPTGTGLTMNDFTGNTGTTGGGTTTTTTSTNTGSTSTTPTNTSTGTTTSTTPTASTASTGSTASQDVVIAALRDQVNTLNARIADLTARIGTGASSDQLTQANNQISQLRQQVTDLGNVIARLQTGQNNATTFGLTMPATFQGLQMPQGYDSTPEVQGVATQASTTYIVKKGDTLAGIAKKVYGDSKQWRRILAANPRSLSKSGDVRTLRIGFELRIP